MENRTYKTNGTYILCPIRLICPICPMKNESFGFYFRRFQAGDYPRRGAIQHLPEACEVLTGLGEFAARSFDRGLELALGFLHQPRFSQDHSQVVMAGGNVVFRLRNGLAVMPDRGVIVSRSLR